MLIFTSTIFSAEIGQYRTVMSYSASCDSGCSRRMCFSNPDVFNQGLPTGVVDERDNTKSLEQTTLLAVNFREAIIDDIFSNGFD